MSAVYARGRVLRREDRQDGIWLDAEVPHALAGLVEPYREQPVGSVNIVERARAVAGR